MMPSAFYCSIKFINLKKSKLHKKKKSWPRKQSIIALYFEFGTVLKVYNLEARKKLPGASSDILGRWQVVAPSLIGVSMPV